MDQKTKTWILFALSTMALLLGCNRQEPADAKPPNVLIVVLDTTRAEAVSAYGNPQAQTPNLDTLAADGALFEQARATSCWTLPTHASIFTGLYSFQHNAHHETDYLEDNQITLAEFLKRTHVTAGFSENPHIIRAKGFAQGFEHYEETWRPEDPSQSKTVEAFNLWYQTRDTSQPFFAFVNLFTPHLPYAPPERWQERFFSEDEIAGPVQLLMTFKDLQARLYMTESILVSDEAFEILYRLYLADTAYVDERLGQILETLEQDDTYDDTLIVITSDHGENIGEHGLAEHQFGLYEQVLRVPMVLRYPGVFDSGKRRQGPVQLVDLAPTILELVGADPDVFRHMAGKSLIAGDPDEARPILSEYMLPMQQRPIFAKSAPDFDFSKFDRRLKSLQIGDYKLIASEQGEPELYDLSRDPEELTNLALSNPEEATRLHQILMGMVTGWEPREASQRQALDEEALERLRSLGYVN